MAFNGTGSFNRLYSWASDKINNIKILASRMDAEMDGFATGLSGCVTRDGQTTTTARIPFAQGVSLAGSSTQSAAGTMTWSGTTAYASGASVALQSGATLTLTGTSTLTSGSAFNVTAPGTGAVSRSLTVILGDTVNARNFGATGDGATDDRAALVLAATAASSGGILLPSGAYRVSSNLTLSVPVTFQPGAKLSIDVGVTVTFSAGIVAPDHSRLFQGSGTVAGLHQVRPEWWGAARDGATDDGPAIQLALNCAGTSGGEVLLSPGSYFIDTALTMTDSGVKLRGCGRTATTLSLTNTIMTVITVSGAIQHWEISGISFVATGNQIAGTAINCEDAILGRIFDIRTYQMYNGITMGNSVGTKIDHGEFSDFRGSGILINGACNDVFISDCIMNGAEFATGIANPASTGIRMVDKAEAVMVQRCEIILCNEPLFMTGDGPATGNTPAYCRFTDCFFDSCLGAAAIDQARDIAFTGCWFSNRPESGCVITNSVDIRFVNCSFTNSHKHGCLVEASSTRVRFVGCTFDSNSQASVGTYAGVIFGAGTTDFVVQGCYAGNGGRFTAAQGAGISVAAGASDRYIVADNLVTGNTVIGVFDGGVGANKRVANNY